MGTVSYRVHWLQVFDCKLCKHCYSLKSRLVLGQIMSPHLLQTLKLFHPLVDMLLPRTYFFLKSLHLHSVAFVWRAASQRLSWIIIFALESRTNRKNERMNETNISLQQQLRFWLSPAGNGGKFDRKRGSHFRSPHFCILQRPSGHEGVGGDEQVLAPLVRDDEAVAAGGHLQPSSGEIHLLGQEVGAAAGADQPPRLGQLGQHAPQGAVVVAGDLELCSGCPGRACTDTIKQQTHQP